MTETRRILRVVPDNATAETLGLPASPEPAAKPPATKPTTVELPKPQAVEQAEPVQSLSGRVFALALLVGTAAALVWIGAQVYHAVTDAWIAPLHLSPDNDAIAQLRLSHQRQLSELARIDAEVTRLDSEHAAVETAIGKLETLRGSAKATLTWQEQQSRVEQAAIAAASELLVKQQATIRQVRARQETLLARAREDLRAGLVDRTVVDREELALDQLTLELGQVERELGELALRRSQNQAVLTGLRDRPGTTAIARMPEVVAGAEHTTRVDLEIERLRAEARGNRALRAAAVASAANQRALLAELEARPLYRAMTMATDVAFVPYDQLAGVHPGSRVVTCTWGLFACDDVGRITEVMPGEVVTQDPWGELARGQYVVMQLDDDTAIRERVLRVRD